MSGSKHADIFDRLLQQSTSATIERTDAARVNRSEASGIAPPSGTNGYDISIGMYGEGVMRDGRFQPTTIRCTVYAAKGLKVAPTKVVEIGGLQVRGTNERVTRFHCQSPEQVGTLPTPTAPSSSAITYDTRINFGETSTQADEKISLSAIFIANYDQPLRRLRCGINTGNLDPKLYTTVFTFPGFDIVASVESPGLFGKGM